MTDENLRRMVSEVRRRRVSRHFHLDLYVVAWLLGGGSVAFTALKELVLRAPSLHRGYSDPDRVATALVSRLIVGETLARPALLEYPGTEPLAVWLMAFTDQMAPRLLATPGYTVNAREHVTSGWRPSKDEAWPPGMIHQFEVEEFRSYPIDDTEMVAIDPVHLGVSAPRGALPGDSFSVRFAAYALSEEASVRQQLGELGGGRNREQMGVARCQWARQTKVTVKVSGKHLQVEPAEQTFEWQGRAEILGFVVEVQPTSAATTALRFEVFIEGVRVAFIPVDVVLGGTPIPAEVTTRAAARTAFASYATADRSLILQKLASIRDLAGIDVFLDCLSLRPSEQWKRRIEEEIATRDLFLLFWCRHASTSEWVDWEWRLALQSKGDAAFQLQPLEPPAEAPPPAELSHLHFNDALILLAGPHPT